MSLRRLTKFVGAGLIVFTFAACQYKPREAKPDGVGASSPLGRKLVNDSNVWCRQRDDGTGFYRVDHFVFNANGSFRLTRSRLNTDASLTPELRDDGTWAILNDQLVLMREKQTQHFGIKEVIRASDGAKCLDLAPRTNNPAAAAMSVLLDGSADQICPCSLQ